MAYSANTDVQAVLGLEASTFTATQLTMVTLMITLTDDWIDGVAGCSFGTTPRGIKWVSANLTADMWRYNQGKIPKIDYDFYKEAIFVAMNQNNADWNIFLGDRVDPFDEDKDIS